MITHSLNTPLYSLTIGEFIHLLKEQGNNPVEDKKYVYGLSGLAELLKCSKRTASAIKASGKIDQAISQQGRKIIIDANLALELLKQNK